MDPFIRQSALEILLQRQKELSADELKDAIRIGLADADANINEMTWDFVNRHQRVKEFIPELGALALKLKKSGDEYAQQLAKLIQKKLAS